MKRGFTLIELVVAIGLLAMVLSFSGVIFKITADAYRVTDANTEIMQKFRAICDQLSADFSGLRKEGEIFVAWVHDPNENARFDRIMFFANGNFRSLYDPCQSNLARITYMIANGGTWADPCSPTMLPPQKRILTRTQHAFLPLRNDPNIIDIIRLNPDWKMELNGWRNINESQMLTMQEWKLMPWDIKKIVLSAIGGIEVGESDFKVGGAIIEPATSSPHMYFCKGVGQFKIQGWCDTAQRWVPQESEGDFIFSEPNRMPGILYPYPPYGGVALGGNFQNQLHQPLLNQHQFAEIPGLGRALRFTFTLYDSKGIIKGGKLFTHIIYLDS